jgi:hypothetical protein
MKEDGIVSGEKQFMFCFSHLKKWHRRDPRGGQPQSRSDIQMTVQGSGPEIQRCLAVFFSNAKGKHPDDNSAVAF